MSKYITPQEIAKKLEVSESTIRKMITQGTIKSLRINDSMRRVTHAQFKEFMASIQPTEVSTNE